MEIATSLNDLASLLDSIGSREEAERLYREAIAIWQTKLPPEHPDNVKGRFLLANLSESPRDMDPDVDQGNENFEGFIESLQGKPLP